MGARSWLAALAALLAGAAQAASPPAPPPMSAAILAWTPAQQAYGYAHMETVAKGAIVKRGARVHPLPKAARQIDPRFGFEGKTWDVASYMRAWRVSGVMAVKDGKVILERYGLGRTPDERWISFSVAKSVTSTLLGAAVADGAIGSLDDPVSRYIPGLRGSAYDAVSIRDLVTMTSGVKWNEDYADPKSDVAQVGIAAPVVAYMRRLPRAFPPGTHFTYDTGETDLAGILVSDAVKKPLAQYLSEKIWKPYGMAADAFWVEDVSGRERGGCCISMRLSDYARFGEFILDGGRAGGKRVLPAGWIAEATAGHVATGIPGVRYGYFWWVLTDPRAARGQFEAEGVFGQAIAILPRDHLVIAINSAWPKADDDRDWIAQAAFIQAVARAARRLSSQ